MKSEQMMKLKAAKGKRLPPAMPQRPMAPAAPGQNQSLDTALSPQPSPPQGAPGPDQTSPQMAQAQQAVASMPPATFAAALQAGVNKIAQNNKEDPKITAANMLNQNKSDNSPRGQITRQILTKMAGGQ